MEPALPLTWAPAFLTPTPVGDSVGRRARACNPPIRVPLAPRSGGATARSDTPPLDDTVARARIFRDERVAKAKHRRAREAELETTIDRPRDRNTGDVSERSLRLAVGSLANRTIMTSTTLETASDVDGTTAIVRTVDLTKIYPGTDFRAVDALTLSVGVGEIFGLLGPNGAGKTTTAGILTTRVIPSAGRAFIADIDVVAHPALAKQLVGVVSQTNTLDRQLNVWENLYFHGRLFGIGAAESRQSADELLEKFQLSKWAKASVYALSGGMAQRLMVARSIFHKPAVLFMDEPTAGLDPQSRLVLWDILRELNAEGQTILLTTHYMEEADQLCGRVAIMDHGKILALDTPARLKQGVGADTIVTVKAAGDQQRLAAVLQREVAEVSRVRPTDDGLELHVRGRSRLLPRLVAAAETDGFEVADLSVSEPSLETVFINLTGRELRD